jgi:hypothetical protein
MIVQQDLVEQRRHDDAVSFGGWAIDLHPVEGVFSKQPGCQQWHSKGVFQIPYRTLYSRNIKNLFLAGRIISASHIAFGSTRVMATCAHSGQAVGMAAAICARKKLQPRALLAAPRMKELQRELIRTGQYIPGVALEDETDLSRTAVVSATSELKLSQFAPSGETMPLDAAWAMMLPVLPGAMPVAEFLLDVSAPTTLRAELRVSGKPDNHTPDVTLASQEIRLKVGTRIKLPLDFHTVIGASRYAFVCLMANPDVAVHLSDQRVTGVLAVTQKFNRAVAKSPRQEPPPGSGIESFEFWIPQRRPAGKNLALRITPPLEVFGASNLTNGFARPTNQPNAWVADFAHEQPVLRLAWDKPQTIARIELSFDTDFDHPIESVLMGHPERVMPFCVREITVAVPAKVPVLAGRQNGHTTTGSDTECLVCEITENHQSRRVIHLQTPVTTEALELRLVAPASNVPAALFEVRCYGAS